MKYCSFMDRKLLEKIYSLYFVKIDLVKLLLHQKCTLAVQTRIMASYTSTRIKKMTFNSEEEGPPVLFLSSILRLHLKEGGVRTEYLLDLKMWKLSHIHIWGTLSTPLSSELSTASSLYEVHKQRCFGIWQLLMLSSSSTIRAFPHKKKRSWRCM